MERKDNYIQYLLLYEFPLKEAEYLQLRNDASACI